MKKILSILLALALMLGAAALAEGNVTIAVQGMNDFSDNIQSMIVYGDKLLLSSWDTLYTWDSGSSAFTQQESVQEDANAYNIVRNHLYGLGKRTTDDPGHGTDTEPTPGGDDEPVSLNNKHEVELALNGNWDVIHDMELD